MKAFPRIFALAVVKDGKTVDFCYYEGNEWRWKVELRRNIFDWEVDQWEAFQSAIADYHLIEEAQDKLVWTHCSNGRYTAKSFCKSHSFSLYCPDDIWKFVWAGVAPPKVEILVWQLLRKRIAVKFELLKRGLIQVDSALCAFCGKEVETVEHLFFDCYFSWRVWMLCCSLWGVNWVMHREPVTFFMAWQYAIVNDDRIKIWRLIFSAICWSLWLHRNDIIFNRKLFDLNQLVEIVKVRLMWWIKASWPDLDCSFLDLYRCPNEVRILQSSSKVARNVKWIALECGSFKFNVDGAARGKPGPAGIGGILRDENGKVWIRFSKSIVITESNEAEICAIREALLVFSASRRGSTFGLVIESYSRNVVGWVN